jgi:hypothetical protein
MIVTCEEPYAQYSGEVTTKRLADYFLHRSRSGYQISGVPKDQITAVTQELRCKGAYVFATSLVEDFYESFECWEEFIQAMEMKQ